MNSALARVQGVEAGHPPERRSKMAQSIWYVCASSLLVSKLRPSSPTVAANAIFLSECGIQLSTDTNDIIILHRKRPLGKLLVYFSHEPVFYEHDLAQRRS